MKSLSRQLTLWVLALCCLPAGPAQAGAYEQQCFQQAGAEGVSACWHLAAQFRGNREKLIALGHHLEVAGRYEAAVAVYRKAVKQYSNDRVLLKGMIRANAEIRARRLFANFDRLNPSGTSDCWTLRWLQALAACKRELAITPNKAALHERLADVLRSLGRPDRALAAYRQSMAINPKSSEVKRKYQALALLVGDQSSHDDHNYRPAVFASKDPPPSADKAAPRSGRFRALVIGNNSYNELPVLETAVNDAETITALLERDYGFQVTTLVNATRYETLKAFSRLRKQLTEQDSLLIYYAGHGFLDETTNRGYWLPVDAERNNFANWISTSDITDTLSGVAAKHAMVVADSCYSGSLLRNSAAVNLDQRRALVKRPASKRSRTVLTSGGLEPVLDDGGDRHSVFAKAFIEVLSQNTGSIEAGRLFVSLRNKVVINADQTPQYAAIGRAGHQGGDFIFERRLSQ